MRMFKIEQISGMTKFLLNTSSFSTPSLSSSRSRYSATHRVYITDKLVKNDEDRLGIHSCTSSNCSIYHSIMPEIATFFARVMGEAWTCLATAFTSSTTRRSEGSDKKVYCRSDTGNTRSTRSSRTM